MPLIQVILILVVIGVLLYLILTYVPMDATIKTIIKWVTVIAVVLWLLTLFFPSILTWGPRVGR